VGLKFTPLLLSKTLLLLVSSVVFYGASLLNNLSRLPKKQPTANRSWFKFVALIADFHLGILHPKSWFSHKGTHPSISFLARKLNKKGTGPIFDEEINQTPCHLSKKTVVMGNSHAVDLIYSLRENEADLKHHFL
jgi:hypothetical protein